MEVLNQCLIRICSAWTMAQARGSPMDHQSSHYFFRGHTNISRRPSRLGHTHGSVAFSGTSGHADWRPSNAVDHEDGRHLAVSNDATFRPPTPRKDSSSIQWHVAGCVVDIGHLAIHLHDPPTRLFRPEDSEQVCFIHYSIWPEPLE